MRRRLLILFTLTLLILAGCGDDGGGTSDPGGATGGAETDNDSAGGGGDGENVVIPSDFAIPTLDGAVIVIDSLPGIPDGAYLQLLYPGDRYAELVSFYEGWVGEQSGEWSPTPADTTNGVIWFSLVLEGEPGYGQSVTIDAASGSEDRAAVSLVAEST